MEQLREDGERDEFKVFLGFTSLEHAQNTFRRLGREDLEGKWIDVPVALLLGMINGEEQSAPMLPSGVDDSVELSDQDLSTPVESIAPIQIEADATPDKPTTAESQALADYMTQHKLDRCEHNRVNECEKCNVERTRGGVVDAKGKHVGWKIAWRPLVKVTA
jgi:hypothetical protein